MKKFLKTLVSFNTNNIEKKTENLTVMINHIIHETLPANEAPQGISIWLDSITIKKNMTDKCILNAEKAGLVKNISNSLAANADLLDALLNKITYSSLINDSDGHHMSISVYQFCAAYLLIETNKDLVVGLDFKQLEDNDLISECIEKLGSKIMKEKIIGEIFLGNIIRFGLKNNNKIDLGKFL